MKSELRMPGQAPNRSFCALHPSGRMTVDGRVVAVRVIESEQWGTQYRMVIRLPNSTAVYSTVRVGWNRLYTARPPRTTA